MSRLNSGSLTPRSSTPSTKPFIIKDCLYCSSPFKYYGGNKRFCKPTCQSTYANLKHVKKRVIQNRALTSSNNSEKYLRATRVRFEILLRDNFTCQYCGRKPEDGIKLHVDHIKPKLRGGTSEKSNLITSCNDCNIGKNYHYFGESFVNKFKKE